MRFQGALFAMSGKGLYWGQGSRPQPTGAWPVEPVAHQGLTDTCQVHADLMLPTLVCADLRTFRQMAFKLERLNLQPNWEVHIGTCSCAVSTEDSWTK